MHPEQGLASLGHTPSFSRPFFPIIIVIIMIISIIDVITSIHALLQATVAAVSDDQDMSSYEIARTHPRDLPHTPLLLCSGFSLTRAADSVCYTSATCFVRVAKRDDDDDASHMTAAGDITKDDTN